MPICVDGDEKEMQREVEKHISVGMPVENACQILKAHGFTCDDQKDERRVACHTSESAGWLVTFEARVWLSYDASGTVTQIEASGYGMGP